MTRLEKTLLLTPLYIAGMALAGGVAGTLGADIVDLFQSHGQHASLPVQPHASHEPAARVTHTITGARAPHVRRAGDLPGDS